MNPIVPLAGGMMLCSISSSIAMMIGGEETPDPAGAGGSGSSGAGGSGSSGAGDTEFVNECTEGECPTLTNAAGLKLVLQGDGNLVLYDANGTALWNTGTHGRGTGPYKLALQDDHNLVLYAAGGPIWSSGTAV